jgi:hypothetical protein
MEESKAVRFEGTSVTMGDRSFIIPPLSFRQLREHEQDIAKVSAMVVNPEAGFTEIQAAFPIVFAAIHRNYADITKDELEDLLDLGNVREAFGAALGMTSDMIDQAKLRARAVLSGETRPTPKMVQ